MFVRKKLKVNVCNALITRNYPNDSLKKKRRISKILKNVDCEQSTAATLTLELNVVVAYVNVTA